MNLKVTKIEDFSYKIDEEEQSSSSIKRVTLNRQMNVPQHMLHGLSNEQSTALEKFANRENIFLTGPAGTGKTYLIQKMYEVACMNGFEKNGNMCDDWLRCIITPM